MAQSTVQGSREGNEGNASAFLALARGYWSGASRRQAWLLTGAILAMLLCNLAVNLGFNRWNRSFYDALDKKDAAALVWACGVFVGLIVAGAAFAVGAAKARLTLQLAWRQWVSERLLAKWLQEENFYKLALTDRVATSPEARIADDVRLATEPVVDFATGFINATLSAVAFVGILLYVGGSLSIGGWTIPGYLAIAAVLYAIAVSAATYFIGKPLTASVDQKNEAEAQFRFGLTRIRENVESIALIKGGEDELRRSRKSFGQLAERTRAVIANQCRLTGILNANAFFAGTFALLLAVPKYLSGELSLGSMMQIGQAFTAVLGALNWFAENYIGVAQWRASAQRVAVLDQALAGLDFNRSAGDRGDRLTIAHGSDRYMVLDGVSLAQRDGRVVVDDADIRIGPGERVLLAGESGTGKSTLVRAVAGLWPWGTGRILLPDGASVAFVPQRPYIPLGTLRDALAYPEPANWLDDDRAREVLQASGLPYMTGDLDQDANLDQSLSGGERQRIAFARLLLHKPAVIVMDEATAALDVESELTLMTRLFEALPEATILSVGHRPALEDLHSRKIVLRREATGARIDPTATAPIEGTLDVAGARRRLATAIGRSASRYGQRAADRIKRHTSALIERMRT